MKREQFEGLIQRLELFAQNHPGKYTLRVALLAALGYAYLFGILALLLAATAALAWLVISFPNALTFKLAFVLGAISIGLTAVIARAMWVRLTPPEGLELMPADVPELFAMIEALGLELRAPRFHRVLLTGDFNAAVLQVPRLGIAGWQKNYLILGLPLMSALSPEQFRSVVAHEVAHLSRNHSRFAAWIYRVRRTWSNIFAEMARKRQSDLGLLSIFIRWYGPYFDAYSFVLARANEYEADRCAVQLAGAETAAQALIRTELHGRLLSNSIWPRIFKEATVQRAPPERAFVSLAEWLRQGPESADARKWLAEALHVRTNTAHTHPCLKDRLKAMGCSADAGPAVLQSEPTPQTAATAAEHFLGSALERCRGELERRWQSAIEKNWKQRFQQAQELQKKLDALEETLRRQPLTTAEQWERAQLIGDLHGDGEAEPVLRAVLAGAPNHPGANFALGRIQLNRDDEGGVELVERAMAADPDAVQHGCNLLYSFYERTGCHEKTRPLVERYDQHTDKLGLARQERARVTAKDHFLPHQLPPEQLADLRRQLQAIPEVAVAHLARKDLHHFQEKPLYVLAVRPHVKWYRAHSSSADQKLAQRLVRELKLPGDRLIFVPNQNLAALGRKVRAVAGAEIYVRARG